MLSDRLPEFMRNIKEISRITQTEDAEFELIDSAVDRCLDNAYFEFADESKSGLDRWEKLFGVPNKAGRPAAERKREISAILFDCTPYTYNAFNAMLRELYMLDGIPRHLINLDYLNYTILIYLHVSLEDCTDEVGRIAARWLPANMALIIKVVYRRHRALRNLTHRELGLRTHKQIQKEGLDRSLI